MKIGVELKIDVTKIEKARLFQGKKGKYLTMTAFIDIEQEDQYGNNGMITHKKDEGEERAPILGNSKVFWKDGNQSQQPPQQAYQQQQQQNAENLSNNVQQAPTGFDDFDSDIPF